MRGLKYRRSGDLLISSDAKTSIAGQNGAGRGSLQMVGLDFVARGVQESPLDEFSTGSGRVNRSVRKPLQNALIRGGIALLVVAGIYLIGGLLGLFPLELENIGVTNIRIVAGVAIVGCLMAAIGYGSE